MDFEDDPLQAALATAFADSPIPQRRTISTSQSAPSVSQEAPVISSETAVEASDDSWKGDYDNLVVGWRAESAAARQRAEQERERWRLIREKEEAEQKEKAAQLGIGHKEAEWEAVERLRREHEKAFNPGASDSSGRRSVAREASASAPDEPLHLVSPSPNVLRALISGETSHREGDNYPESSLPRPDSSGSDYVVDHSAPVDVPASTTTPPSNPDSKTWEEVPSLDSSFPSLSFADRSPAQSPEPHERPPPPSSVTLAIFDSSLSKRARFLALASSLAINLLLPFVNGVMLGFGEIFAKNLVSVFGWELPGTQVGIRATRRRKQN